MTKNSPNFYFANFELQMKRFSTPILPPSLPLSRRPIFHPPLWQPSLAAAAAFLLAVLAAAVLISQFNLQTLSSIHFLQNQTETTSSIPKTTPKFYPLNCSSTSPSTPNQICPNNYPTRFRPDSTPTRPVCPDFFRWIHEDLRPWAATGITRAMVEAANATAHFRLVVIGGRAYVEHYKRAIQTRDLFTIWGILQLLRRYPGEIPDLELMFDCDDRPVVKTADYRTATGAGAPPVFRYCGDEGTMDIVFPDWSFWGWAEINIRPWENLLKELKEGNERSKWMEREPFAYWKGNPSVADTRQDLLKCNLSHQNDWNALLYIQDWIRESQQGYKQSNLASQCTHRYKIYIEGYAWSVSEKYILACDSMTLLVKPNFYDFFTRSLQPVHHYWPIRDDHKCPSIKFAVHWGNSHKQKAQAIGKAASDFIQQELKMDNVYNYMFHLLNQYAKLLQFQPEVPKGAVEVCSETVACPRDGLERKFMEESMVKTPSPTGPCAMLPPFDAPSLQRLYRRNANLIRQVEEWEDKFWENLNTKKP